MLFFTVLGGVSAIAAIITFLIKFVIKRFRPLLLINSKVGYVRVLHKDKVDYIDEIKVLAEEEDKQLPKYDVSPIDPYQNPLGSMKQQSDQFKNKKLYMANRKAYLKAYIHYLNDKHSIEVSNSKYEKLTIEIRNKGRLGSSNIKITLIGDFFIAKSEDKIIKKPERPIDFTKAPFGVAILSTLKFTNETVEELEFIPYNNAPLTLGEIHLSPKESSQIKNIYIDNSVKGDKVISYEITAQELSKPVQGNITITIV